VTGRLYLENRPHVPDVYGGVIRVTGTGIFHHGDGGERTQIMPETTAAVLVGGGCTVSSAAVRSIVEGGAQLIWLSKTGLKVEAVTPAPTGSSLALLERQARLVDPALRRAVAVRSLAARFGEEPPGSYSENQLRGWEGAKVRAVYITEADRRGFRWSKRVNDTKSDLLNSLISACNASIYTAVHAGLLALNMSPHLGWLHAGEHAAVFDFAEHYKLDLSIGRVFDWFAARDRDSPLPSSFAFARQQLPETVLNVFSSLHTLADEVPP